MPDARAGEDQGGVAVVNERRRPVVIMQEPVGAWRRFKCRAAVHGHAATVAGDAVHADRPAVHHDMLRAVAHSPSESSLCIHHLSSSRVVPALTVNDGRFIGGAVIQPAIARDRERAAVDRDVATEVLAVFKDQPAGALLHQSGAPGNASAASDSCSCAWRCSR